MDFTLDDEQVALRDAVRGLIKGYDAEHRRSVVSGGSADQLGPGFDEQMWQRFADMGLLGLPFGEDHHGMGAGPVEVAIVAEEMGRVLAPEPFIEAVVLAGGLIDSCGSDQQRQELLPRLASGELVPIFAGLEPGARWSFNAGGVRAAEGDDGWSLTGVKEPVVDGERADLLIVSALVDDEHVGLFVVDPSAVEVSSYLTFDGGRAARIILSDTAASPLGEPVDRTGEISDAVSAAQVAYCHEALGAMDSALHMTTSYLTTRKQFGVTLNRFQALTFRAADMYTSLELTRSIVTWATMVLAEYGSGPGRDHDKVVEAAARAKLQTSKTGRHIGQEAIQLHGGIGMTAEYTVGHIAARLTAIDHLLGDGRAQAAKLVETLDVHTSLDPIG